MCVQLGITQNQFVVFIIGSFAHMLFHDVFALRASNLFGPVNPCATPQYRLVARLSAMLGLVIREFHHRYDSVNLRIKGRYSRSCRRLPRLRVHDIYHSHRRSTHYPSCSIKRAPTRSALAQPAQGCICCSAALDTALDVPHINGASPKRVSASLPG